MAERFDGKERRAGCRLSKTERAMHQDRDETFMRAALTQAAEALAAGEFPVGCVVVQAGRIVASGSRKNSAVDFCEMDHAEIVALRNLQRRQPDIDLSTVTIYSTMEPCLMCFSTLIVNNVKRVVYGYEDAMGGGTNLPLPLLAPLYREYRVEVVKNVLRDECLQLFRRFFLNPENTYLQGTFLAEYTLSQK